MVGRPELTPKGRWMVATLACGDGAALSHRSAAELWGIGREEGGRVDVSIRRASRLERPGIFVHARPKLPAASVVVRFGIPVTDPVQTLIDLATELRPLRLERAVRPLALSAGFPQPLTKHRVLGYETDGLRYHRTASQQARMVRRDQKHVAAGYTVLRFTHWQIAHAPDEVTGVLRQVRSR